MGGVNLPGKEQRNGQEGNMADAGQKGRPNRVPTRTELVWEGKYDEQGRLRPVDRIALPFQTIEVINEPRARTLFSQARGQGDGWRNKLIWGDNKYVMASLLEEFAGKIDLFYITRPTIREMTSEPQLRLANTRLSKNHLLLRPRLTTIPGGRMPLPT